MKIRKMNIGQGDYFVVDFDKNELRADGGKLVPYAFSAGTLQLGRGGKIKYNVWTPAASVPRGYKAAAKRALETAAVMQFGRMK